MLKNIYNAYTKLSPHGKLAEDHKRSYHREPECASELVF